MNLDPLYWADYIAEAERSAAMVHCARCKKPTKKMFKPDSGVHYGRLVCEICGTFQKFVPNPEGKKKARSGDSINLAEQYGIEYCEMCLRQKDELPEPQTIFGHHVIEHQDGGSNERSNIWGLCAYCHEQIGLIRRRIGHNKLRKDGAA